MKKLFCLCVCVGALMVGTAEASRYGATPVVEVKIGPIEHFLPSHNEALDKALATHNLLNKLPELQKLSDMMRTMGLTTKKMQKYFDSLMKCNEQRFSGRFKNPRAMVDKVRQEYNQRVAALPAAGPGHPDSIVPQSIRERDANNDKKRDIEAEIMTDIFKNGAKYGGQLVDKSSTKAPETMVRNSMYSVFQEMNDVEQGLNNSKLGEEQITSVFNRMQDEFARQLKDVGLEYPTLDLTKGAQVLSVRKALKELKGQYIEEAKQYIARLDEQDAAHPDLVAKRAARSGNKQREMARLQEQFPDAFSDVSTVDYQTPQQQQQLLRSGMTTMMQPESVRKQQ